MTDFFSFFSELGDLAGGDDSWESEVPDGEIEEEWDNGDDSFFDEE